MIDSYDSGGQASPLTVPKRQPLPAQPAPAIAPPPPSAQSQPYAGIQAQPRPNIIAPAPNPAGGVAPKPVNMGTWNPQQIMPPTPLPHAMPPVPLPPPIPPHPATPGMNIIPPAPSVTTQLNGGGATPAPTPYPSLNGSTAPAPGTTGGSSQPFPSSGPKPAIPLNGLGGLLEQNLGNPSRYDADVVKDAYGFLKGDLEREATDARSGAINDANSRGVYYGTPLNSGLAKVDTDYQRGLGSLATSLMMDQAHTYGNDRQASLDNAFRFGENQQRGDQFNANLGLQMGEFGSEGAPNINNAISQFGQLPLGANGQPLDLSALGKLYAMLNQGKAPGTAGAATTGVDYSGNNPYSTYA